MSILIYSLFEQPMLSSLSQSGAYTVGTMAFRQFPDKETYIRFEDNVEGKDIILLDSLNDPNPKILPLIFAAKTAKALGANSVGLCAPYLSYMRQDKQFKTGEGISSDYFAELISNYFDWLVTVDSHLHRHHDLSEIYSIPAVNLHACASIASYIIDNIEKPLLIGPDSESAQWVQSIAEKAHAPFMILEKTRRGNRDVSISVPELKKYQGCTPVLIDDIVSSAHTMIETIKQLKQQHMQKPICIAVHPIFADNAYQALQNSGAEKIISCNSISHPSNKIDLSNIIYAGIENILKDL